MVTKSRLTGLVEVQDPFRGDELELFVVGFEGNLSLVIVSGPFEKFTINKQVLPLLIYKNTVRPNCSMGDIIVM